MELIKEVKDYVRAQGMLNPGDAVVAGVSGGADSMCLLDVLMLLKEEYDLSLFVVHVNHGIRGESADADEKYVKQYCSDHNIVCRCVHEDVPALAACLHQTEEEAGRNVRYQSFVKACEEFGATKIAVAHNRDDNAETVLFNLFRGSGISGIRGIAAQRELDGRMIIRPLLMTSRKDIEKHLKARGISYVTDETNNETDYSRNRIRNMVLPLIRDNINSAAVKHISDLAGQAGELEQYVEEMTGERIRELEKNDELTYSEISGALSEIRINAERLHSTHRVISKSIIRVLLGRITGSLKDIESKHIESVLRLSAEQTGKSLNLPYNIIARRDYKDLVFSRADMNSAPAIDIKCEIPGEYQLDEKRYVKLRIIKNSSHPEIPKNNYTKWFDYDKIQGELRLRTRCDGDYLCVGAGKGRLGHKSLKSYFIDKKTDRLLRGSAVLLASGSHVLWVLGERRDDSFFVTDTTINILEVELGGY